MPRHFSWRSGKWLVFDEESGLARYSDDVIRDYYGRLVTRRFADGPHPQEFVQPIDEQIAPPFTSVGQVILQSGTITTEDAPDNPQTDLNLLFTITDENNIILEYVPES